MKQKTITKEEFPEDILDQLELSLEDAKAGRIRRVR